MDDLRDILIYVLTAAIFVLIIRSRVKSKIKTKLYIPEDPENANVREINQNIGQIEPRYYGYGGGFASTTKCIDCGRTALREDQHTSNPCHECGGKVIDDGAAKWNGSKWIKTKQ